MLIYLPCKLDRLFQTRSTSPIHGLVRVLSPTRLVIARLMGAMLQFCDFFRKQRQIRGVSWFGAFFVCALVFAGFTLASPSQACGVGHIDEWARVAYIYDGDTLRLSDRRIIRFMAINAPELSHDGHPAEPLAAAAKQALMRLLPPGSRVGLRFGQQHFGPHHRVLAHVFDSHGHNVSIALLRKGLAFAIAMPPNLWQSDCYFRAEAQARTDRRGIWGEAYYQPKSANGPRIRRNGFYRLSGRITHIGRSRRSLWLDMGKHFAVRIPRKDLAYFSSLPLNTWQGKVITVRGWARFYYHKLNLSLTHPAMIEKMP